METIREWASQITESQKSSFNSSLTDELLKRLKDELSSDTPDYEGCVVALTTLHHKSVAIFYERLHQKLPQTSQAMVNQYFFAWINEGAAGAKCSKTAQAIQQRLKNGENVENIILELQWYIKHVTAPILQRNIKKIWNACNIVGLKKLFLLHVADWAVDESDLLSFYSAIFQILQAADGKTDWTSMFADFLEKNHLVGSESSVQAAPVLPSTTPQPAPSSDVSSMEKVTPTAPLPSETSPSIPAQNTTPDKIIDVHKDMEDKTAEKPMAHDLPESSTATHKESSETPQPDTDPDKDGVKLAERLLAWARTQVQGTSVLKSSLKTSNNDLKRLEERFSNLQSELFAAKEEIAAKEVTIAVLQRDLADANTKLKAEQAKSSELDGMVSKLQQMNENSATQAVLGYKAELAAALKSIVEDARLPEAQHDAEILSALLADLLDTLHFKGVPLEVDEK